jgi:protein phosphatase
MRIAWKTDTGKKKRVNEDAILIDRDNALFLLADGMSGPRAGRVASRLAVRKAHARLRQLLPSVQEDDIPLLLKESIAFAHQEVQNASVKRRALSGMGTTLIVLYIHDDAAYLCHVGDSRAYLIRKGMELITSDHTHDHTIENDVMIRELFFYHKVRVLSQALGPSKSVACDGHGFSLQPNDIIVLCSDGLTDMLPDSMIETLVGSHRNDLENAVEALVEAANQRGGKDNISVILVGI